MQSTRRGILDERTDQVRGRLDAVLIAARVAPTTSAIGIVPVATTTHTEPFHVSKAIATLDYVSHGRAGLQARVSATGLEARQFGRRVIADPTSTDVEVRREADSVTDLFDEAADFVEVVRRLWDSWEDDAEIRDVATGRFVDRDKLHYIDFEGRWFSVKGPSITPRPPQGQPLVAGPGPRARRPSGWPPAAPMWSSSPRTRRGRGPLDRRTRSAPHEAEVARTGAAPADLRRSGRLPRRRRGRRPQRRKDRLDERLGRPLRSDAFVFVGTPAELVDLLVGVAGRGHRRLPASARRDPPRPRGDHATNWSGHCRTDRPSAATTRTRRCGPASGSPGPPTATPDVRRTRLVNRTDRGRPPMTERPRADPPGRPLSRGQQHHGVERPRGRQPHRVLLVREAGPDGRAGQVRLLLPGRGAPAARAARARSTTSTSSGDPTPSPCWPPWPRSPTGSGCPAPSTPPSTSPTRWPGSSPPSTTSPAAGRPGTWSRRGTPSPGRTSGGAGSWPERTATTGPGSSSRPPASSGTPGTTTRSSPTRRPGGSSATRARGPSSTTGRSSTSPGASASPARPRATR